MCAAALLGTLMVGQIQPTCNFFFTDSTGDTLAWILSTDGVGATFSVEVTRRPSGDYVYTYGFRSDSQSTQNVATFRVVVAGWDTTRDTFIVVDSMKGPYGWGGSTTPLTRTYPSWLDPNRDSLPIAILDPLTGETLRAGKIPPEIWNPRLRHRYGGFSWNTIRRPIVPGDTLDSLMAFSPYPPDPAHYFLMGDILSNVDTSDADPLYPNSPPEWWADSGSWQAYAAMDTCDKKYTYRKFPFAGVAPGWPVPAWPAAYGHLEDRLERVDSLGWFLDSTLKRELDSLLTRAYEAYKRRQYLVAFHNLSLALGRLNTGRGSRINDLGYFVLYYRFLEAREKLPGSPEEIRRTSPR